MVFIPTYNPCSDFIKNIKSELNPFLNTKKEIKIYYDNYKFLTNISLSNFNEKNSSNTLSKYTFNNKTLLFKVDNDFYENNMQNFPELKFMPIGDLYLEGIVKRMLAHLSFGYYSSNSWVNNMEKTCDTIFKSLYTKSISIKEKSIAKTMETYDIILKETYAPKKLLYAIIYMVYDYNYHKNLNG